MAADPATGRSRLGGQAARYLLTGSAAAVVDLGGFAALDALGVGPPALAAALSFLPAAAANYLLTSTFVFRTDPRSARRAALFLAFATLGMGVNAAATAAFAAWLVQPLGLPLVLAKAGGIGVAFVANFLVNALVVFRAPAAKPGAAA